MNKPKKKKPNPWRNFHFPQKADTERVIAYRDRMGVRAP